MVSPIILNELCLLWASGKRSLAAMYRRNPAKKPRYKISMFGGMVNKKVESAPRMGAKASSARNRIVFDDNLVNDRFLKNKKARLSACFFLIL